MAERIKCPHCGFDNASKARFCGNCSYPLTHQFSPPPAADADAVYCPYCESPNPPGAPFCGSCGRQLTASMPDKQPVPASAACPHCGQANPVGATFCGSCGRSLTYDEEDKRSSRGRLIGLMAIALLVFLGAVALFALPALGVPLPGALAGLTGAEPTHTPRPRPAATEMEAATAEPIPPTAAPAATAAPVATALPVATAASLPTLTPFPTPTPRPLPTATPTPIDTATPDAGPERLVLGQTGRGTPIEAVRFGNGPQTVMFIGGLSAGFAPSTVALAEAAVDHFSRNPTLIPENLTVFIVLSASPDSPVAPGDYRGRLNANGVDVNRNWGCNWAADTRWSGETKRGSGGTSAFSEAESRILRDFIKEKDATAVIFWQARAEGGLVSPGGCGERVEVSAALAGIYGLTAGYRVENFEDLTRQILNGDASNYLDSVGVPAASVLLPNYSSSIDWQNNLDGIMAVLNSYAD